MEAVLEAVAQEEDAIDTVGGVEVVDTGYAVVDDKKSAWSNAGANVNARLCLLSCVC